MYCSKCGKEVTSEERFCLRCGSHEQQQRPLNYGNDETQGTPLIFSKAWYYLVENRLRGPLSERSMRKNFIDGFLNGKVLVRYERGGSWRPAGDVPEFKDLFKYPNTLKRSLLRQAGKYLLIGLVVCLCFPAAAVIIHARQTNIITNNNERAFSPTSQGIQTKNEIILSSTLQWGLTKDGVIAQTNKVREENGVLPLLTENQLLNAIANERLNDMFKNQYFSHHPPSGKTYSELARRFGYAYSRLAENLASGVYGNDKKIIDGWMQSPGHRANILSPDVSEIGVAVRKGFLNGQETWIGVQIFGHPSNRH